MSMGKVLVVDDEVYILHILDFSLGAEGFEVITANNGELAIEKAKQERPNLIVLDVMMPVLDGYETCRRMFPPPNVRTTAVATGRADCLLLYCLRVTPPGIGSPLFPTPPDSFPTYFIDSLIL